MVGQTCFAHNVAKYYTDQKSHSSLDEQMSVAERPQGGKSSHLHSLKFSYGMNIEII